MYSFKPCYKWITFNTKGDDFNANKYIRIVLNLVINGLPSILKDYDPNKADELKAF